MERRFWECALVFSAVACFATTTALTVPADRKVEALAAGVLALPLLATALFTEPFLRFPMRTHLAIVLVVVGLALAKHWLCYFATPFFPIISFSLIFSLGQAACALSVLELYRVRARQGILFLALCTLVTVAAASYTATGYFLPLLLLYFAIFVGMSRAQICEKGERRLAAWQGALLALLVLSSGTAILLRRYREEINNWTPDGLFSPAQSSGFSPITRLGSRDIETSRDPVLRYFAPRGLYHLRGKVFDRYDGGGWYLSEGRLVALPEKMDAAGSHTLLYLRPEAVIFAPLNCCGVSPRGGVERDSEGVFHGVGEAGTSVSLHLASRSDSVIAAEDRYTQLPQPNAAYFAELAQRIAGDKSTAQDKVKAFLLYLDDYPYRLQSAVERGEDPIASFLRKREGAHCEMFASALVMLARAQGIPARYVAGYYAHEWNELGRFFSVRACDAHAWAEVFLPGGWATVDPTPQAELQRELRAYRGVAEGYREFLAEQLRRLRAVAVTALTSRIAWVVALGGACAFLWLRRKKISAATRKKPLAVQPQPVALTRLRNLSREFAAGIALPRREAETLREYYRRVETHLGLCPAMSGPSRADFARKLRASLEDGLYGDRLPGDTELDYLESLWRQLAVNNGEKHGQGR